jgi:CRISPR-associated endonuclease Cas2
MAKNKGRLKYLINYNEIKLKTMAKIKRETKYVKDFLTTLLTVGCFIVAATSPYFLIYLLNAYFKNNKSYKRKRFVSTFNYLKNRGLIRIEKKRKQIYIHLTEAGKKLAEKYQIGNLKIKKPRKWDKKWRIIVFDIPYKQKFKRESLRSKLKELGFYQLQKSVWLHPFNCQKEIDLLRNFFGLKEKNLRIITANNIGCDKEIRRIYKI